MWARYTSKFRILFDVKFKEEGGGEGREGGEGAGGEDLREAGRFFFILSWREFTVEMNALKNVLP